METPFKAVSLTRLSSLTILGVLLVLQALLPLPARAARAPRAGLPAGPVVIVIQGASLSGIVTNPLALAPTFAPTTTDYALRCVAGQNAVVMRLTAANGGTISDGTSSGPALDEALSLSENQAAVVVAPDPAGGTGVVQYWVRCLPHDFPQYTVRTANPSSADWYLTGNLVGPGYAMILDGNGTPVWYQASTGGAINFQRLPDGTLSWAIGGSSLGTDPVNTSKLVTLGSEPLGGLSIPTPPMDFHELLQLGDGSRVFLSDPIRVVDLSSLGAGFSSANNTIADCLIQVTDPAGNVTWSWRASDHVSVSEAQTTPALVSGPTTVNGQPVADIFHCNSVDIDPGTGDVLVSMRHTSAVYRISRSSGMVEWKLGGNNTVGDGEKHLAIVDSDGPFSGQHDARFLSGGHVSLFDDKTGQSAVSARGVDFAIDPSSGVNGTATLSWEYKALDGKPSLAAGSFRRYATGHNLIDWGFTSPGDTAHGSSRFTDVDSAQPAKVLMDVEFIDSERTYRTVAVPRGQINVALMRSEAGRANNASYQPAGGVLTSKPAVASWGPRRLDVFARGADNALWHRWWDGIAWSDWESLGGILASGPAAVSWTPGRIDVVVRGVDDGLWHLAYDAGAGGWTPWEPEGGILSADPGITSWGSGRLDVVVRGADGGLWHKCFDGGSWCPWENLGGILSSDPAAVSVSSGTVDLFARGGDGGLWHIAWNGSSWSSWGSLGGLLSTGPSATAYQSLPGQLQVMAAGLDGAIWRLPFNGSWGSWEQVGGSTGQTPALAGRSTWNDIFYTGNDSQLYEGGAWP